MGLFIATGTGLSHDNATLDLISIAAGDTGYGETNISADRTLVTYARTLNGPCQLRLDDLVNNTAATAQPAAAAWASPPDIVIFPGDSSFLLPDGTPITAAIGLSTPVGSPLNPTANDIAAIYDTSLCDGDGVWADKEGGGTVCAPSSVIIYHELAHCFHYATGTTAATSAQEEVNAEIDENDQRDQLNLAHRDVTSHNGGCGCGSGGCCIIASISTGSMYSDEVIHLRVIRDKMLRRTEVGNDFFNSFFYAYYGFSPEICSVMGNNPELSELIKIFFVAPVLNALELMVHYTENKGIGLTAFLKDQTETQKFKQQFDEITLHQLNLCLDFIQNASDTEIVLQQLPAWIKEIRGFEALFNHLRSGAVNDQIIRWSLLDSLQIWVKAATQLQSGAPDDEIETFLYEEISEWFSRLPVTAVWNDFSRIQTEIELNQLSDYIFDSRGKKKFAGALINQYPNHKQTVLQWSLN